MLKRTLLITSVAAAMTFLVAPTALAQTGTNALSVIGLTADQRLVAFNTYAPRFTSRVVAFVTGLTTDTAIVGIDYRVQDSQLYGVGNAGGVYTINAGNGAATLVNRLSVPLTGTRFGVDFNPAADRLRITSDTGQNLRHNVNAGGVTLTDGALNDGAATPNVVLGVAGSAYTNNDLVTTTGTTLFDINTTADTVALQAPPNAGTLATTGALGVLGTDGLPADIAGETGFDIYSVLDANGATVSNRGFAVLASATTGSRIYGVDVTSGRATEIGTLKPGLDVVDIAVTLNQ